MNREVAELWSAAIGAAGTVIRYGHWGRPVLVFPSERGRAWDFENYGMVGAVAGPDRRGTAEALLRRQLRRRVLVQPGHPAGGASPPARPLRVVDRRRRRAVDLPGLRRPGRGDHARVQHGRLPRGQFRPQAGRPVPAGDVLLRQLRPAAWHGWGERGHEAYFNNPLDYVGHLERRPPGLAARPGQPAAGLRPGPVGGHHRRAAEHQAVRRAAGRQGHQARSSTCGATTCPTTGLPGVPSWPTTCRDSAETTARAIPPLTAAPGT